MNTMYEIRNVPVSNAIYVKLFFLNKRRNNFFYFLFPKNQVAKKILLNC